MKKNMLICIASFGFLGTAVFVLGLWFIGYPEKLENLATDHRCSSDVRFVIAGNRLFRLGATEGITAGDLEYMSVYQSYIEDIFSEFQGREFGLDVDRDHLGEFVPIDEVLITKILPPEYGFVPPPYHNLTMGGLFPVGDVDGDEKGDFIASTADTRCSTGRLDYLVLSTKLDFSLRRNHLDEGSGVLLTSDRWTLHDETPAPYSHQPLASDDGERFIFNRRVVENLDLGSHKQIDLDSIATQNLSSNFAFFYGDDVVDARDGELELADGVVKFPKGGTYNVLNDLDGDGEMEIVAVYQDRMIVHGTAGNRVVITFDNSRHLPDLPILGSHGDFDQDGVTDFWLGFPYREDARGEVVGGLEMVNGAKLQKELRDGTETTTVDDLSTVEIIGTDRYDSTSSVGIGYDLSREAGDIDGDGLPDLVTVSHYDLQNRGIVYAFLSRDLARQSKIRSDAPNVVRVMGKALSYIGTGLDTSSDFDGDGVIDIVVGADVDHEAGFGAGAIYYLSGRKVSSHRDLGS
jgi:hypothetical protein